MLLKRLFLATMILLVAQSIISAQDNYDPSADISTSASNQVYANPFEEYVLPFLKEDKDSWLVLVTRSGGIMGGFHLVAAVTSEGNSICKEKDVYKAFPLKDDIKLGLLDTVSKFNFAVTEKPSSKKKGSYTDHCNDCYSTSMEVFHYYEKDKLKTYTFGISDSDDSAVSRLYGNVVDSYECPLPSN